MRSGVQLIKAISLSVMAVIAIAVLAFGGRTRGEDALVPADFVVVDYWEKWTGNEGAQMKSIVDDFNRTVGREKKIFVRYVNTSQIDKKTLIATAAGVPPDIAGVWDNTVCQLAARDGLMPLDDLAREHGITRELYKPVYWDACVYNGKLVALVSTPATIALHINMRIVRENADKMRAAGLDPNVPPRSIAELDRWAQALDVIEDVNGSKRIVRAGYLPAEPGWYLGQTPIWFGTEAYDQERREFNLNDPRVLKAMEWVSSYTKRLGPNSVTSFRAGFGNFDSPQNPFLSDTVVMVQQGPWMANYIRNLKPSMSGVKPGETLEQEIERPLEERLKQYDWIAVPFPADDPSRTNVGFAPFDALTIPRGAKHPREAFEFIAYIQRQDVHEKLNMLHCKNSALAKVSDRFLNHHPNPYIKVFEALASSPHTRGQPLIPINAMAADEIGNAIQDIVRLDKEPAAALAASQARLTEQLRIFRERQALRKEESR
jgi:ABC-type glycerol-3-phosphate transport system substrate-binding protein